MGNSFGKEDVISAGQIKPFEMGFWLDSYDDLFSDFDPRPYSKRQLSDDFLFELRRRFKETPKGGIEVDIYLPKKKRDLKVEVATKKKIREYFSFELSRLKKKQLERRKTGLAYLAAGVSILMFNAYVEWEFVKDRFLMLVGFMLAPAGWFSAWTSFERFLIVPSEEKEKEEFYTRMHKCNYSFFDLEDAESDYSEKTDNRIRIRTATAK